MTDMRDKPTTDEIAVFLAYHSDSPWAHAKARAGLVLTPESLEYMRREIAARADATARFAEENDKFEATRRKEMGLPEKVEDAKPSPDKI